MDVSGPRASFLIKLCNKYENFKVAFAFKKGDKIVFSEHKQVLELWTSDEGMKFLEKANNRRIFPAEIVLDMDDDVSELRLNSICDDLEKYGFNYKAYFTGSKGYHIHVFDDELTKYSVQSRRKIKHFLIAKYNCDTQKASENTLIAIEDVPH
ncbi:MAG: hypothetical protein ABIC91_05060 [Nanoarchaeota archaeon]|nr:hypothetical protein [Nanoarchaeota archaeon]MBU1031192.1 hypothetical protein [Nanoarchaeota archaeon]